MIVASILVAFAIDALWDQRGDQEQARAFLEALAEDFEEARVDLDRNVDYHRRIIESSARIVSWAMAEDPKASCEAADDPFSWLMPKPTLNVPGGTVETILGSGRVDLIRNQALVRELTRWSSLVAFYEAWQQEANSQRSQHLLPLLLDSLNLREAVRDGPYVWPGATDDRASCDIVLSQLFQNVVYLHWINNQVVMQEALPPLTESIETVRRLIREELAR